MKVHFLVFLLLTPTCILSGCVTIFSDFQSAETLGKGNTEISANTSLSYFSENDEQEHVQTNIGLQFGLGISESVDLRSRIEMPSIGNTLETFGDYYVFGLGPKMQLIEGRMSGYLPIGFLAGKDVVAAETFEMQPTLLFTIPVSDIIEINPSFKYTIPIQNDRPAAVVLNIGSAIWIKNVGIRPEIGFLKTLDDNQDKYLNVGIGLSLRN